MCMLNITTYKITVTRIASRMIPAIRPPINAPASPLASVELSHEGVQTWLTVAVVPLIWIKASAPLMSAQFLRVVIMSVAVTSPLLLEYATVVVKVALMPSAEHVSWESSRLTEVKLQEHWSRTTPERLSSSDWVLFCSSVSWKSDKGCEILLDYKHNLSIMVTSASDHHMCTVCLLYWSIVDFLHTMSPVTLYTVSTIYILTRLYGCVSIFTYLYIYYLLPINLSVYISISWFIIILIWWCKRYIGKVY